MYMKLQALQIPKASKKNIVTIITTIIITTIWRIFQNIIFYKLTVF